MGNQYLVKLAQTSSVSKAKSFPADLTVGMNLQFLDEDVRATYCAVTNDKPEGCTAKDPNEQYTLFSRVA
jgi:hypothetical protein